MQRDGHAGKVVVKSPFANSHPHFRPFLWMRPLQVSVFAWDLERKSGLQGREALQVVAQFGDLQHLWQEWGRAIIQNPTLSGPRRIPPPPLTAVLAIFDGVEVQRDGLVGTFP